MYLLISVLIIVVCVLLVMIVLVQNSKGGGLAANFSGSTQIMGVRRTADFIEKATWTLAGALLVFSLLCTAFMPKEAVVSESAIRNQIENAAIDPNAAPNFPTAVPADNNKTQQKTQGNKK